MLVLAVIGGVVAVGARTGAAEPQPAYIALAEPTRFADTRPGELTFDHVDEGGGKVAAGGTLVVHVAGRAGLAGDITAIALNATVTQPEGNGYLTIYPCNQPRPTASNVNYGADGTVANSTISAVADDGTICIFTLAAAHIIVDALGTFVPDAFAGLPAAARLAETRPNLPTIDHVAEGTGKVAAGATLVVPVAGRAGLPDDVTAVAVNATATQTEGHGYLTIFPCDEARPTASTLNYLPDGTVANGAISRVADDGTICIFTLAAAHIVVDVSGSFAPDAFIGLPAPSRIAETRPNLVTLDHVAEGTGKVAAGSTLEVPVPGRVGLPDDVRVVAVNVTATQTEGAGYLTIFPCGRPRPTASTLNYLPGQTIANSAITVVGDGGNICIFTLAAAHIVIDVSGHFPAEVLPPPPTVPPSELPLSPGRNASEFVLPASAHPRGVALVARVFLPDGSSPRSTGPAFPVAFGYHGSGGLHVAPNTPGDECTQKIENTYQQMTDHLLSQGVAVIWIDSFFSRDPRFCEDNDDDFKQFAPPTMDSGLQQVVNRIYDTVFGETAFCRSARFDCSRMMRIGTSEGGTAVLAPSHRYIDHSLEQLFEPDGKLDGVDTIAYHPLPANRPVPRFVMAISPGCGFYSAVPLSTSGTKPIEELYYPSQDTYLELGTADDIPDDCAVLPPEWEGRRQLQVEEVMAREGIAPADSRYRPTLYPGGPHALWPAQRETLEAKLTNLIQTYLK